MEGAPHGLLPNITLSITFYTLSIYTDSRTSPGRICFFSRVIDITSAYAPLGRHSMGLTTGLLSYSVCHHALIRLLDCHGDSSLTACGRIASSGWVQRPPIHLIAERTLWGTRQDLLLTSMPSSFSSHMSTSHRAAHMEGINQSAMHMRQGREGGGKLSLSYASWRYSAKNTNFIELKNLTIIKACL